MRILIQALAFSILTMSGSWAVADVSEATFTPQGNVRFAAIREEQVEIFVIKPEFKFRVIGVIEARGMAEGDGSILGILDSAIDQVLGGRPAQPGEKEDIALAMRAVRKEAAQNGISKVLIVRSTQARVSANATERRIIAAAILAE
jgi:hypothetical protein